MFLLWEVLPYHLRARLDVSFARLRIPLSAVWGRRSHNASDVYHSLLGSTTQSESEETGCAHPPSCPGVGEWHRYYSALLPWLALRPLRAVILSVSRLQKGGENGKRTQILIRTKWEHWECSSCGVCVWCLVAHSANSRFAADTACEGYDT